MRSKLKKPARVIKIFAQGFYEEDVLLLATSMAFSSIFALVPVLAIFTAVSQWAGNLGEFSFNFKELLLNYITSGAGERLVTQLSASLGGVKPMGIGIFGLVGLLSASIKIIYDFDSVILRVWNGKRHATWWKRGMVYILILILSPLAISVAAGLLDWDVLKQFVGLFSSTATVLVFLALFLCFKFTPPEKVKLRSAFGGAVFSYILLKVGQKIYLWSTVNVFAYDKLYGSLAFVPLFLFWLFLIWVFILAGLAMTKAIDEVYFKGARTY
ncbi:MAG TPA: hypothetical protein DCL41_07980 [Bdellovibrionales bacterium]|nr:hypothetical protein [Pseudobdellovibrionaceae bacterium]HAG91795.1 hypothetical protein [Bdellovibrionales bacterium]|tara:strand:+ start:1988 stop:2797 length:810 start_codon:yes stop_codon:yes gene_type:complete